MKKIVIIVLVLVSQIVNGQKVKSCMEYDANRTLEDFRVIVLTSKDPFMKKVLWPEYARLANAILQTSANEDIRKFVVTPDLEGMKWLMAHTYEYEWSYYKPDDFHNGVRINDKLEYRDITGQESSWASVEVGDVFGVFAKIKCCNSEERKIPYKPFVVVKNKEEQQKGLTEEDWAYSPTNKSSRSLLLQEKPVEDYNRNLPTITTTKKVIDWGKVATIGGITIGVTGVGLLTYYLLNKKGTPVDAPPVGGDTGGPQDGQPVGP